MVLGALSFQPSDEDGVEQDGNPPGLLRIPHIFQTMLRSLVRFRLAPPSALSLHS